MKKSILFFILDLGKGGAEKVLTQLVKFLDPDKYDITVQTLCDYGINKKFLPKNIKYRTFFRHRRFRGMFFFCRILPAEFLYKLIIRKKYDVVIAYLENISTKIVSGCKKQGTLKIAYVHSQFISSEHYKNEDEMQRSYESFDKVAFVSQYALESFKKLFPDYKINPVVVYNTIDTELIKKQGKESIDIKLKEDIIKLVSTGRLEEIKGYIRLMDVLGKIKNEGITNWHFYLLGEGTQRKQIEEKIEQNGLTEFVTLLGFEENPHKYVSKMDMFVCSSYNEGYSTAVTESILNGTPVLTTECSGMDEIIGTSGCGEIVNNSQEALYEGLKKYLNDTSKIEQMKGYALKRACDFSTEKTIKQFESIL